MESLKSISFLYLHFMETPLEIEPYFKNSCYELSEAKEIDFRYSKDSPPKKIKSFHYEDMHFDFVEPFSPNENPYFITLRCTKEKNPQNFLKRDDSFSVHPLVDSKHQRLESFSNIMLDTSNYILSICLGQGGPSIDDIERVFNFLLKNNPIRIVSIMNPETIESIKDKKVNMSSAEISYITPPDALLEELGIPLTYALGRNSHELFDVKINLTPKKQQRDTIQEYFPTFPPNFFNTLLKNKNIVKKAQISAKIEGEKFERYIEFIENKMSFKLSFDIKHILSNERDNPDAVSCELFRAMRKFYLENKEDILKNIK